MDEQISERDEADRWEINAVGLEEEILYEMCENPMRTDRGCDGMCSYDKGLHKRICKVLSDRMKPLQQATVDESENQTIDHDDCISRQAAIYVASGYCHSSNIAKELAELPSVQPNTSELINRIRKEINSKNRNSADYFIVDRIENILDEWENEHGTD